MKKFFPRSPTASLIAASLVLILVLGIVRLEFAGSDLLSQSGKHSSTERPERAFKRSIRDESSKELPVQLKKFRDGLLAKDLSPADLSKFLASVPSMSEEQANAIIDDTDHELLADYLGGLPFTKRNDLSNNQLLYTLLANKVIADDPMAGIDIIKRMGPGLNSHHLSDILTKAALDPTGVLASRISRDLIPYTSWAIQIDGKLLANLLGTGLTIGEAVAKIEALPGARSLAGAAITQYYLMGYDAPKPNETERRFLLEYSSKSDLISLKSKAFQDLLED